MLQLLRSICARVLLKSKTTEQQSYFVTTGKYSISWFLEFLRYLLWVSPGYELFWNCVFKIQYHKHWKHYWLLVRCVFFSERVSYLKQTIVLGYALLICIDVCKQVEQIFMLIDYLSTLSLFKRLYLIVRFLDAYHLGFDVHTNEHSFLFFILLAIKRLSGDCIHAKYNSF